MNAKVHRIRMRLFTTAALSIVAIAANAPADIFQWEYINPADPSQGKQLGTTLTPDGAGVDVVPGAALGYRDFTMAYLIAADLTGADIGSANLTNADLSRANLTIANLYGATLSGANFGHANLANASLYSAQLTNADFTGAEVRGASFGNRAAPDPSPEIGLTTNQLYSTASYQGHDLRGIGLQGNYLANRNFTGQDVADANFSEATLTDADFTDTQIRGADFSIHYYNLIPGVFEYSAGTGITLAQLYSTASFKAHDLTGIKLKLNNLDGANFAGQNLANANFAAAALTGASFRGANLANAEFAVASQCHPAGCGINRFAALANADLSAADARGAHIATSGAITSNLIQPDGHISGLDLQVGGLVVVRDYNGSPHNPALVIPITIDQHLSVGPGGTLRMVFEADAWDSTISFSPGIPVALGGTLELTFADGMNLASQLGRTFHIFNWTGVHPAGTFAVASAYAWDLSKLYNSGDVILTALPEPYASLHLCLALMALIAVGRFRILPDALGENQ